MERHIDQSLERIREDLLRMGGRCEEMISTAMVSLMERDLARATSLVEMDREVDRLEIRIDDACHTVLATRQPTAVDLRFVVAAMKITNDLERIGDSAVNIAQSVPALAEAPPHRLSADLTRLSKMASDMVRSSLDAFLQRDAVAALGVCESDDQVDDLYKLLFQDFVAQMVREPESASGALHLLLVARNIERIADHATNIAEDVVYFVEGRDIRHQSKI